MCRPPGMKWRRAIHPEGSRDVARTWFWTGNVARRFRRWDSNPASRPPNNPITPARADLDRPAASSEPMRRRVVFAATTQRNSESACPAQSSLRVSSLQRDESTSACSHVFPTRHRARRVGAGICTDWAESGAHRLSHDVTVTGDSNPGPPDWDNPMPSARADLVRNRTGMVRTGVRVLPRDCCSTVELRRRRRRDSNPDPTVGDNPIASARAISRRMAGMKLGWVCALARRLTVENPTPSGPPAVRPRFLRAARARGNDETAS